MALLNFQKQFKEKVRSKEKTQTIRKERKHPIKKGETLYLYTGLRTKYTEKLREAICRKVRNVYIDHDTVIVNGVGCLEQKSLLDKFAVNDGFGNYDEMLEWFSKTHGLPFKGILIEW